MSAKILLIDDSATDIQTLIEILRDQQGFRVFIALTSSDGYNKAIQLQPELILLDRMLPDIDGLNTCRLLKSDPRTRNIPVIFLTAMQSVTDKVEGFKLGVCDYITKPWHEAELLARLRVHIDLHRRLNTITEQTVTDESVTKPTSRVEIRVQKAQALYLQDLSVTLTLSDIAHQIGTHARQLAEDFRQVTGDSVHAWLRSKRMNKACELLLSTELEVSRIAEASGYTSAAAFSNAFRDYYGMPPSEYRRNAGLTRLTS